MRKLKLIIALFIISTVVFRANAQHGLKKAKAADLQGKCLTCLTTIKSIPPEVTWNFKVKNGGVYFYISDFSYIEKLFPNAADGIAVDLVLRSQYQCGKMNKIQLSSIKKGKLLEPAYYSKFSKNIKKDKKTGSGSFRVADLPANYTNEDYEMNMLLIKDRTVCYTNSFFGISASRWELLDMGLLMDTTALVMKMITTTKTVFKDYEKKMHFIIPFQKNKWEYSPADIKPLYDSLRLTDYQIFTININAYSSIEGSTANNIKLQNKRAKSIVAAMKSFQNEKIKTKVTASENWVEFLEDMEKHKRTDISKLSKTEIKDLLNNQGKSKEFEKYLRNHRKAVVTLELKKRTEHQETSNDVIIETFNKSIVSKDLQKALAMQQELFARIGEEGLSELDINKIKIPTNEEYAALISNRFIFNFQNDSNIQAALDGLEPLYAKQPENLRLLYNICAIKLIKWSKGEALETTPRKFKNKILILKKAGFDKQLVSRLLMNFHIVRSAYSMQKKDYEAKNRSVNFIKGNYRKAQRSDEDMIKVGKFLVSYGRLDWAEQILYPHAKRIDVGIDLIFYYLNLTITNPENNDNKKYRTVLLNAINQDKAKFCKMFTNYNKGGVTFQMLSDKYLKSVYCETCK